MCIRDSDITVQQTSREDGDDGDQLVVTRPSDRGEHRALHGLTRTLVANMVVGVTDGFEKRLEIQGVGYRAQLRGRDLELALGYSHPVSIKAPDGIEFEVPLPTRIVVRGASKQQVGEVAAVIRKTRSNVTAEQLVGFLEQNLAKYKVPQRIVFVDEMPMGKTGKKNRNALRAILSTESKSARA